MAKCSLTRNSRQNKKARFKIGPWEGICGRCLLICHMSSVITVMPHTQKTLDVAAEFQPHQTASEHGKQHSDINNQHLVHKHHLIRSKTIPASKERMATDATIKRDARLTFPSFRASSNGKNTVISTAASRKKSPSISATSFLLPFPVANPRPFRG